MNSSIPIDPVDLTNTFLSGHLPSRLVAIQLLHFSIAIFKTENTIIHTTTKGRSKLHIVGDVHGQYYDLQHIFKTCHNPSPTNAYIFNGDVVDRGSWSIECLFTLLAWKLKYPKSVYINRGNHESKAMTARYGFKDECLFKYDHEMYDLCCQTFNCLPLGVVVDDHTFIVHGGLTSKNQGRVTFQELNAIDRFREPPHDSGSFMMELLWSDPMEEQGIQPNKRGGNTICFGPNVTRNFMQTNTGLKRIIRSHQVVQSGIQSHHHNQLYTVFSAPNYCDRGGNLGCVIVFEQDKMSSIPFKASPHPDLEPMVYMKRRIGERRDRSSTSSQIQRKSKL